MKIECPYCRHGMDLKEPKPGRFKPKCTKCLNKFSLRISADADIPPKIKRLKEVDDQAQGRARGPEVTRHGQRDPTQTTTPNDGKRPAGDPRKIADNVPTSTMVAAPSPFAKSKTMPAAAEAAPARPPEQPPDRPQSPADEDFGSQQTLGPESRSGESAGHQPPAAASPDQTHGLTGDEESLFEGTLSTPGDVTGRRSADDRFAPGPPAPKKSPPPRRQPQPEEPADSPAQLETSATQSFDYAAARHETRHNDQETVGGRRRNPTDAGTLASGSPRRGESSGSTWKIPDVLGGYRIVKELGRGAMGAVYLANQISLDRLVALKLIDRKWADNPVFIARFTREAYAAAQLVHHNVVQIYDLGLDKDVNFFSMEFVKGRSLAEEVEQHGRLDPDVAVGYVLQAARGLEFAHNQGMIHRDVKPANLMLNDLGVVKVADLGLVKTAGAPKLHAEAYNEAQDPSGKKITQLAAADVTFADQAMGTPDYMPPEQAEDAANVDHRADIYSLGCTLFVLLTGKPPFQGTTALEVMKKHFTDEIVRPDELVSRVPREVSEITLRMAAKRPEDRFQSLGEAIDAMEEYLGVQGERQLSPDEEHADALENCARRFHEMALVKLRSKAILGFFAACAAIAAVAMFISPKFAGAAVGLAALTGAAYFVASGVTQKHHLFTKVREVVFSSTWGDWLTWAAGSLVFVAALWVFGWLWLWIGVLVLAVALAVGFHFTVDRQIAAQREQPLQEIEKILKRLRLRGMDEVAVRNFLAKYAGRHWEELFERLFGYEAMIETRRHFARQGESGRRARFQPWRDPIIRRLDTRLKRIREQRERKHLEKVEQKGFQAEGLGKQEARQRAEQAASVMVEHAADVRKSLVEGSPAASGPEGETPFQRRERIKAMLAAAREEGQRRREQRAFADKVTAILSLFIGQRARFLLGVLLVVGCVFWMHKNNLLPDQIEQGSESLVSVMMQSDFKKYEPLELPVVGRFFRSFNPGAAGLILIASSLIAGLRICLFVLPAAAVVWLGPSLGMPSVPGLTPQSLSIAIGVGLAVLGVFFGRSSEY